MFIDVGKNHRIELETLAGLGVDNQDAALSEDNLWLVVAVESFYGGSWVVQGNIGGLERFQVSLPDSIVRRDDADQLAWVAVRQPQDALSDNVQVVGMVGVESRDGTCRGPRSGKVRRRTCRVASVELSRQPGDGVAVPISSR